MTYSNNAPAGLYALFILGCGAVNFLQDPAVRDAWREAVGDCASVIDSVAIVGKTTGRAVCSVSRACTVSSAAWRQRRR